MGTLPDKHSFTVLAILGHLFADTYLYTDIFVLSVSLTLEVVNASKLKLNVGYFCALPLIHHKFNKILCL